MQFLYDLLYPPRCPLCDKLHDTRDLCVDCETSVHFLDGDFTAAHLDRAWFRRARSLFAYEGKILDAIHNLKYFNRFDLVHFFTKHLIKEVGRMGNYDFIIPVPMHWRRLWRRGYNQSAVIAKSLGRLVKCKVELHALKKCKNIRPQVGLDRDDRLKNIKNVFQVNNKKILHLEGSKILLVDDVLTTGATVNECSRTLVKQTSCAFVDILTIARTI